MNLDPGTAPTDPAMKMSLITSAVTAIIGLLVVFGIGVTPEQAGAIVTAVLALAAAAPLVSGWLTRSRVFSPHTVAQMFRADADDDLRL
jgi:hypothetical protein